MHLTYHNAPNSNAKITTANDIKRISMVSLESCQSLQFLSALVFVIFQGFQTIMIYLKHVI